MSNSKEVNLAEDRYWFSPVLIHLKKVLKGNQCEIMGMVLAPFIVGFNVERPVFDEMYKKLAQDEKVLSVEQMTSWLPKAFSEAFNEDNQMDHYSTDRPEAFNNIVTIAREMYFPDCLKAKDNIQSLVNYYTLLLSRLLPDPIKLKQLNDNLRQYIHEKCSDIQPEKDMNLAVSTAKALYCTVLVCALSKTKFLPSENPIQILHAMVPESKVRLYPRTGSLADHSAEIAQYILAVESFPCGTMERFKAMTKLWETKNYYAGWELYQQYRTGDILSNTAGTRYWQLVADPYEASRILKELEGSAHSVAVKYCKDPQKPIHYFPYALELSRQCLLRGEASDNLIAGLKTLQASSDEAKMLYYMACRAKGRQTDTDFLDDLVRYGNAELWDLLVNRERNSALDLLNGAKHGSVECLRQYLEQEWDIIRLENQIYELIRLADEKQALPFYAEIQSFYLKKIAEPTPFLSPQHRDNIQLLGLGLRRLRRLHRHFDGDDRLDQAQNTLEDWLNQRPEDANLGETEFLNALDDLVPGLIQ